MTNLPPLTPLSGISNGALKGDTLPTRMKFLNYGSNPSTKGDIRVGQQTIAMLEKNQKSLGFERVAIDFDHASVPGSDQFEKGKVPPIFGYGRPVVIVGDGVFLEDIKWTPDGEKHCRNFEDISPAVGLTQSREVNFVHSVALTTNGSLYDVSFFSAGGQASPLRGRARMAAAFAAQNAARNQTRAVEGLSAGQLDQERTNLLMLLSSGGRAPINPANNMTFTADELGKMDLQMLRILLANTPGRLRGRDLMEASFARVNAQRGL